MMKSSALCFPGGGRWTRFSVMSEPQDVIWYCGKIVTLSRRAGLQMLTTHFCKLIFNGEIKMQIWCLMLFSSSGVSGPVEQFTDFYSHYTLWWRVSGVYCILNIQSRSSPPTLKVFNVPVSIAVFCSEGSDQFVVKVPSCCPVTVSFQFRNNCQTSQWSTHYPAPPTGLTEL